MYELRPEDGKGRVRVMHRNLMLPCDFLPVEAVDSPEPDKKGGKKTVNRDTRKGNIVQGMRMRITGNLSLDYNKDPVDK